MYNFRNFLWQTHKHIPIHSLSLYLSIHLFTRTSNATSWFGDLTTRRHQTDLRCASSACGPVNFDVCLCVCVSLWVLGNQCDQLATCYWPSAVAGFLFGRWTFFKRIVNHSKNGQQLIPFISRSIYVMNISDQFVQWLRWIRRMEKVRGVWFGKS